MKEDGLRAFKISRPATSIPSISCLVEAEELRQTSSSSVITSPVSLFQQTLKLPASVVLKPVHACVPTTANVFQGVVEAIPTLPAVELTTNTSVFEPFCIRTAVVEEIFCWKPPAAVKNERVVPPEDRRFKRLPVCEAPAVISMPELVLAVVESTVKILAPAPSSTLRALVYEPAIVNKAKGEVVPIPILPV